MKNNTISNNTISNNMYGGSEDGKINADTIIDQSTDQSPSQPTNQTTSTDQHQPIVPPLSDNSATESTESIESTEPTVTITPAIGQIESNIKKIIEHFISEIAKLNKIKLESTQITTDNLSKLNDQLKDMKDNMNELKVFFDDKIVKTANTNIEDSLNTATKINSILTVDEQGPFDSYINLKLDRTPTILAEQVDITKFDAIANNIVSTLTQNMNEIMAAIGEKKTISDSQIIAELSNIDDLINNVDAMTQELTKHVSELNQLYDALETIKTDKKFESMQFDENFNKTSYTLDGNNIDDLKYILNILHDSIDNSSDEIYNKFSNMTIGNTLKISDIRLVGNFLPRPPLPPIMEGGSDSASNPYMQTYLFKINKLTQKIDQFKEKNKEFTKSAYKYNILYIQVYNHLLFIVQYTQSIFINNPKYNNTRTHISYAEVIFYLDIIRKIQYDIKNKKTNKLGKYFFKYFYINIFILQNFFSHLMNQFNKPRRPLSIHISKHSSASKLSLTTEPQMISENTKITDLFCKLDHAYDDITLKAIFIFNLMENVLIEYYHQFSIPIGVYLRINDWGRISDEKLVFKKVINTIMNATETDTRIVLDEDSLQKCIDISPEIKQNASSVYFNNIFDDPSNEIIASKMSLPSFLGKKQSIMLITYGYSGVGKTYTVFGDSTANGILQNTIKKIVNKRSDSSIMCKTFEIYGLGVPYYLYWQSELRDSIYTYDLNYDITKITVLEQKNDFLNTKSDSTYYSLSDKEIENFGTRVNKINNIRKKDGRIKYTKNNPESSRSIMIYDFKITLQDDSEVHFVIVDLPGKEDIVETFIDNQSVECITVKQEILTQFKIEYGNENMDNEVASEIIKKMAYCNPCTLALSNTFSDIIYRIVDTIRKDNYKYTYVGITQSTLISDQKGTFDSHKTKKNLYALEYLRNIIELKDFDTINKIYEEIFVKNSQSTNIMGESTMPLCSQHSSFLLAPFEGYYINENITGIMTTLLQKYNISDDFIEPQPEYFSQYYHLVMKPQYDKGHQNIEKELVSQTYLFRHTLYQRNLPVLQEIISSDTNLRFNDIINAQGSYNYDKVYRKQDPPIKLLLDSYFSVIDNYYLMYVVTNTGDTCLKQIEFINNTKKFLNALSTYKTDTIRAEK